MQSTILWADDEIELLKPHLLFLEGKGYIVDPVTNGQDALDRVKNVRYDIIFLDENMPGLSGLSTLSAIKELYPSVPVVMITKSEEEQLMEEAIGSKIADYLIKPVNPNQILLCIKKILDKSKLETEKTNFNYQKEFRQLGMQMTEQLNSKDWAELYSKLVYWELELDKVDDIGMREILELQKKEANHVFCDFVEGNYVDWLTGKNDPPAFVHQLIKNKVLPIINKEKATILVIDNLRFDQWKILEPILSRYFSKSNEEIVYSILPTATHYARNAFFSGLMPSEIEKRFSNLWKNEEDEEGKNLYEKEFLSDQLNRLGFKSKWSYTKITNYEAGKKLSENFHALRDNNANFIVYNFVDMMSHARTEMEMIRELAEDEKAYRSLTASWFIHSPIMEIVKKVSESKQKLIITTDHGTIKVKNPVKIIGDRKLNSNLRYKTSRGLSYNNRETFSISNPKSAFLPEIKMSAEFVFCRNQDFFVYPNNFNHFNKYYNNTFQHGGISMEELLIPFIILEPKM